jgi:hypothetical protein
VQDNGFGYIDGPFRFVEHFGDYMQQRPPLSGFKLTAHAVELDVLHLFSAHSGEESGHIESTAVATIRYRFILGNERL